MRGRRQRRSWCWPRTARVKRGGEFSHEQAQGHTHTQAHTHRRSNTQPRTETVRVRVPPQLVSQVLQSPTEYAYVVQGWALHVLLQGGRWECSKRGTKQALACQPNGHKEHISKNTNRCASQRAQ